MNKSHVQHLQSAMEYVNFSICLDWLAVYYYFPNENTGEKGARNFFPQEVGEGHEIFISEDCFLISIDRPTIHFHSFYIIFFKGQEAGSILTNSRNEKFIKKDVCKVEFKNDTLYSGVWKDIEADLRAAGLRYKGCSRIDIAIDNVGYLHSILNIYAKQSIDNRLIRHKNSYERRARFNAKVLNQKKMQFENITIGTGGGNKMVTIYNKSLEIAMSGKKYIIDYWMQNGVIDRDLDFEKMQQIAQAADKREIDLCRFEDQPNIYRFELRMKAKAISEIEGFGLDVLKVNSGLASIVKLHCKNYFEFTLNDDSNISRCTRLELLPYHRFGAVDIKKIERQEKDGEYKAKMLIHSIVSDLYKNKLKPENYNESIEMIFDRVYHYHLAEFLDKKLEQWHDKYKAFLHDRYLEVMAIITVIKDRNREYAQDYIAFAARHNQAEATARFGG